MNRDFENTDPKNAQRPWKPPVELIDLISKTCDGLLSDADKQRLNEWLAEDARARNYYVRYLQVHARLQITHGHGPADEMIPVALLGCNSLPEMVKGISAREESLERRVRPKNFRRIGLVAAAAAVFGGIVAGVAISVLDGSADDGTAVVAQDEPPGDRHAGRAGGGTDTTARSDPPPGTADPPVQDAGESIIPSPAELAASLTGVDGARWHTESYTDHWPSFSDGDMVELVDGLAELTFAEGAKLVLHAPARLQIASAGSAKLVAGTVAASIPGDTATFILQTPRGELSERDCAFAATVDLDGATEVHVYSGKLGFKPSTKEANEPGTPPVPAVTPSIELLAEEARRLIQVEGSLQSIPVNLKRVVDVAIRVPDHAEIVYAITANKYDCRLTEVGPQPGSTGSMLIGVGDTLGSPHPDSAPGRMWLPFLVYKADQQRIAAASKIMLDLSVYERRNVKNLFVDLVGLANVQRIAPGDDAYTMPGSLLAKGFIRGDAEVPWRETTRHSVDVTHFVKQATAGKDEAKIAFRVQMNEELYPNQDGLKNCISFFTAEGKRYECRPTLSVAVPVRVASEPNAAEAL